MEKTDRTPQSDRYDKYSIKFTHEEEKDQSILFLDSMIMRDEDGMLYQDQNVQKKTHTDQHLDF